ncbi:MAG TPA: Lrp/AsnC ligand binding domain-containing protein [Nitrososphaera sp.]|nr:Lrp/AsnC ligand binding domain-containing protein [Nitrososphaera sp.]
MPIAFILVSCETDSSDLFAADMKKIPNVEYAVRVSGVYEFFVKVRSDTEDDLKKLVRDIRTSTLVRSSSTLMVVKKLV